MSKLTPFLESLFKPCVVLLEQSAALLGMSYKEIIIWIFVIIEPIVFLLMCIWIVWLINRVRALKKKLNLGGA